MDKICMLSFDIEDYFQVDNLKSVIKRSEWENKTLRVEKNTETLLNILDKYKTKATFFILGWIAEKVPKLIYKIHKEGHEIASHGYGHDLVYTLSEDEFRKDLRHSKMLLEDITGEKIYGYRAPNFSITDKALDILFAENFLYDSSFFPSVIHDRYGKLATVSLDEKLGIGKARENLYEVIISTIKVCNKRIPWGGGAYFRILPYQIYKAGVKKILKDQDCFVFYFHPWEIDPEQPKIKGIKLNYKIRHYIGQKQAKYKLDRLIGNFEFTSIMNGLKSLRLI